MLKDFKLVYPLSMKQCFYGKKETLDGLNSFYDDKFSP